jgi:hypothetical protein
LLNSFYLYIMRYMLQPPPTFILGKDTDDNFKEAVEVIVQYDRASPSLLQRRLAIGYARAARLMDQLEAAGVVSPMDGSKPREVLIRSAEEVFGDSRKQATSKEDDPFEAPKNYKIPTDLKLSRGENISWGKQFSDVFKIRILKTQKLNFRFLLDLTMKATCEPKASLM